MIMPVFEFMKYVRP